MPKFQRFARPLFAFVLAVLASVGLYAGYQNATGNVHEVVPDILYRSGQLGAEGLERLIETRGIRTIVNLRGAHPGTDWYDAEAALAASDGIRYVPISISARSEPPMETMLRIADVMRHAPRPILVHCRAGADRTGLAAAIFQIVAAEGSAAAAGDQLSVAYGHFPWFGSRTIAMDRALADFSAYWDGTARIALEDRDATRTE